jgi:malonate transporter and related proteins
LAITEHVIPLFILIGLGFLARRTLLTAQPLTSLNQFVYYFALPALMFHATYQQDLNNLINPPFLGAFLLAALLTALVAVSGSRWLFRRTEPEQLIMHGLNSIFANYAYMGIPLLLGLLGDSAYGPMISIILAGNLFMTGGAQLLMETVRQKGSGWKQAASIIDRSLVRNPIFLSVMTGILFASLDWSIPSALSTTLDMLAPAVVPVALFCLGASLEGQSSRAAHGELIWQIMIKLIIHPLITLGVMISAGIEDPRWLLSAVLMTALPTGALTHVIAMRYEVLQRETTLVIVGSTLLSLASISGWIILLMDYPLD